MDPRLQVLSIQPRLRQMVSLNGRSIGMVRTNTGSFVAVRPHNLTDLNRLVGKEFYWGEQRFQISEVSAVEEESWLALAAKVAAEPDLRKKHHLSQTLAQLRANGPVFIRLNAAYSGGAPP